ncbi:DUF2795 domain-containing protein [Rhodopila sp.]|uniref:DUF2795 domain-containing protein n=1 Tax=Rhodopila sp. TaxID=2480087 RepID=UPI003D137C48
MAQSGGGHSPVNITHFLKGIDFPAKRDDLLRHARQNHAEQEVLREIEQMPNQDYGSMADVMKGFGKAS